MKKFAAAFCALSMITAISCNDAGQNTTAKNDSTAHKTDTATKIAEAPAPPMDSAAMMKAWMEYMTPGEMHKMLAAQDGTWSTEVTSWMAPGAPPQTSKGSCVNHMILGGRFQESRFSGSFDKMPFEGIGTMAYDNSKKKFVSSWVDNMGTGIMNMEGTYDPSTKTISMTGKMLDPTTSQECSMRQTIKIVDDKHHIMEMFAAQHGQQEYKNMEIKFTKK